jgi:hypothetical protein
MELKYAPRRRLRSSRYGQLMVTSAMSEPTHNPPERNELPHAMCSGDWRWERRGEVMLSMFHYTNSDGYKSINSPEWLFRAAQPPGDPKAHPFGAYFTDLPEDDPMLAKKLRIPRVKIHYVFEFIDHDDLRRLPGDRGRYIFYSRVDYGVRRERQLHSGLTTIGAKERT